MTAVLWGDLVPARDDDFWLDLRSPERFAEAVVDAVAALGPAADCVERWVPIPEPNGFALDAYVTGARPPHRRMATGHAIRCVDHMLAAHAFACGAIKAHRPDARVALVLRPAPAYELGQLFADVLAAPAEGVARADLREHLEARRRAWYASQPAPSLRERALRQVARSMVPLEQALPRAVAAAAALRRRPFDP